MTYGTDGVLLKHLLLVEDIYPQPQPLPEHPALGQTSVVVKASHGAGRESNPDLPLDRNPYAVTYWGAGCTN